MLLINFFSSSGTLLTPAAVDSAVLRLSRCLARGGRNNHLFLKKASSSSSSGKKEGREKGAGSDWKRGGPHQEYSRGGGTQVFECVCQNGH